MESLICPSIFLLFGIATMMGGVRVIITKKHPSLRKKSLLNIKGEVVVLSERGAIFMGIFHLMLGIYLVALSIAEIFSSFYAVFVTPLGIAFSLFWLLGTASASIWAASLAE